MIILTFMLFFVFMGFILFSQNEESSDFDSLLNSWFNIFVLFTLANYPDIQIPYYANNRLSFFYFLFFIVIGLYLFLNFLLAVIFNTYKALQTHETEKYEKKVDKFFNDLFDEMSQSQLEESITLNDLLHALGGRVALKKDERMKKIIF
jgi:magnesium-transporting ATPase (P-type)